MAKIDPISGFPEWTPSQRIVEQKIIREVERKFELHGYVPVETRSIEPLNVLLSKGDDKEIYVLKRLHAGDDEDEDEGGVGLHFDLTVPFARYAVEFQHLLSFPFKRYQIQKVWRGERKQEGRYREFYQCDIDIIGQGSLPLFFDAELPCLLSEILVELPIPAVVIKINNRKVLEGFYRGLGIEDIESVLRVVDKLPKIGPEAVKAQLEEQMLLSESAANSCLSLGRITSRDNSFVDAVNALGVSHPLLEEGLKELSDVVVACNLDAQGDFVVDLSIARGLSYYTGTVYEGYMVGHEHIGAICSGGRYDNLATGGRQKMPGVGVSIGITRILGYLFGRNVLRPAKSTPVEVLVALLDEPSRAKASHAAQLLRKRSISADVYHSPHKFGKQIKAAVKRNIRYVLFIEGSYQVKDTVTGDQYEVDINQWCPEISTPSFNVLMNEE